MKNILFGKIIKKDNGGGDEFDYNGLAFPSVIGERDVEIGFTGEGGVVVGDVDGCHGCFPAVSCFVGAVSGRWWTEDGGGQWTR